MNSLSEIFKSKSYTKKIVLFAVGLQIVLFLYNLLYGQMHIDEVMLMLNARSIAAGGTDILGEKLPMYFDTWIYGGQSPLPTYISALTIKLFGYHLWIARLPMLLISVAALIAFSGFARSLFQNNLVLSNLVITFYALQPARIHNSTWVLDCAYFAPFFLIGLFFLQKSVNAESRQYLYAVLSMLFFALGCYSYITSVLIVPLFLLIYYLVLIKNKKCTFGKSVISAAVFIVFILPLIAFGMVQFGIMDDFSFAGFSFSAMADYKRQNDLLFMNEKSELLSQALINFGGMFAYLLFPDFPLALGFYTERVYGGLGYFTYGHIVSVALIIVLAIWLAASVIKKRRIFKSNPCISATICSFCITYFVYSMVIKYNFSCAHRYALFFAFFNLMSGVGAYLLLKGDLKITKGAAKSVVVILIIASTVLMAFCSYNFVHASATTDTTKVLDKTFDYVEENEPDSVVVLSKDEIFEGRISVYLRHRYYDSSSEFEPVGDELKEIYSHGNGEEEVLRRDIRKDGGIGFDYTADCDGLMIIDREFYDEELKGSDDIAILEDYGPVIIAENTK